jgi:hypothetical protein
MQPAGRRRTTREHVRTRGASCSNLHLECTFGHDGLVFLFTMRRLLVLGIFAACAPNQEPQRPTAVVVTPAPPSPEAAQKPAAPERPKPAPADPKSRFPAGPGVTLVSDELSDLLAKERWLQDGRRAAAEKLEAITKALGEPPVGEGQDQVWYAVVPKTVSGPFGCRELRFRANAGPFSGPADHQKCGLPYNVSSPPPAAPYEGGGPRWTIARLRAAHKAFENGEARALDPLGKPDKDEDAGKVWYGLGPRDEEAPLTCWALRVGGVVRVSKVPLTDCSVAWPPPASAFEATAYPPVKLLPLLEDCKQKCTSGQLCVVERRVPKGALVRQPETDVFTAAAVDGRPLPVELTSTCATLPAGCTAKTGPSCLWKPPAPASDPGPCDPKGHQGHAYTVSHKVTGLPYALCWSTQ